MATQRLGRYAVRITVDLLIRPEWAEEVPVGVHDVAWTNLFIALEERRIPLMPADEVSVVHEPVDSQEEADIGMRTYSWTFTFPIPSNHPDALPEGDTHE